MIEKFLRRFIQEDTKVILAAVEKWTEDRDMLDTPESNRMIGDYLKVCPRIDRAVIVMTYKRGNMERIEVDMRKNALDTAAKILMGEKFERKLSPLTGGALTGSQAAVNAQAQAAQQAAYNQLGSMGNQLAMQNMMTQQSAVPAYMQGHLVSSTSTTTYP